MDTTNRNTALASAMVEELARCGVRRAVVSPGSRSTPLAIALWRQPSIEVEMVLDERSAGFFALGSALATGVPAAVLCTSGSAAANLHPAVVEADEAGVPMIVLTADRPPELRGVGAGQAIDQLKLYGDAVRWFSEVGTHDADDSGLLHFRSVACRAFALAAGSPRPGPVHLNVPWREPLAPVPVDGDVTATDPLALEGRGERPLNAFARSSSRADDALLDELAERIASAPRGLIVAGRQLDPQLGESVAALAEAAGYPLLAEPTSQIRWSHDPPSGLVCGYGEIARGKPEALAPELIVRIGELPTSKPLRQWFEAIDRLRQIVIDPAGEWKEPTRRAETLVQAYPGPTAFALAERLKAGAAARRSASASSGEGGWHDGWLRAEKRVAAAVRAELDAEPRLSEPGVWTALAGALRDGDQVLAASSMPVRDMEAFLPPGRARVRFFANRGANGIDGLVSTASGLAASGDRTWAVLGDLALAHDVGGLAVAAHQPGLRMIVVDNGGGGIFHFLPQAEVLDEAEFEPLLGTPSGLEIEGAAKLYGLDAAVPGDAAELDDALRGDARVVVVRTERAENLSLHRRISDAAAAALVAS